MNGSNIMVSVCCLAFNHEKYIAQAIEGFLMQKTNFPFEIIIHDDASLDSTASIIKKYCERFSDKIVPIYQTENQYSKGIRPSPTYVWPKARGKYIALCEGDDYWTDPYKLQKQVDFLETNPGFAICFHNSRVIDESNLNEHLLCMPEQKEITTIEDIIKSNYIPTASVVFRNSDLMKQLPEWFYKLPIGDWPLHILNAQFGKIKYIPEVMSVYRKHENSIWSSRKWIYQLKSIIELYNAVNSHFKNQYKNIIETTIDDHINWRFNQAIDALSENKFVEAYEYFSGLSSLFPKLLETKLGEALVLILNCNSENPEIFEINNDDIRKSTVDTNSSLKQHDFFLSADRTSKIEYLIRKMSNSFHITANSQNKISIIDDFQNLVKLDDNPIAIEKWNIESDEGNKEAIFAHAPSKIYYKLQTGKKGKLEFGIYIHKDCWEKEEAKGGCVFNLIVNKKIAYSSVVDPVLNIQDRGVFKTLVDIPENYEESHELIFEIKEIGQNNNFRWSLWVEPTFYPIIGS